MEFPVHLAKPTQTPDWTLIKLPASFVDRIHQLEDGTIVGVLSEDKKVENRNV